MERDKKRHVPRAEGDARTQCERIIHEQFGVPWEEVEPELRALQCKLKRELEAWKAWKELRAVVRRIERIAFAEGDGLTAHGNSPRESIAAAKAATEQAANRREFADAFPLGLGIVDEQGVRYRMPVCPPPGHPWLHNKSYLEHWIKEFSPGRLLEWRGDDLPLALSGLRRRIGDHRAIDELLQELGAWRSPLSHALPDAPPEDTQWIVFLFEAGVLSFAPEPQKVSNEAVAAVYALLNGSRDAVESLKGRIAKARERYRAGQAGPENAPRQPRGDKG